MEAITTQGGTAALKLVHLQVCDCKKLRSLQRLSLSKLPKLISLSPRCFPSSLQSLSVDVGMLSCMSKHELGLLFQRLTSLSYLYMHGSGEEDVVNTLLKESSLPTSLQHLHLSSINGLKCLEGKGLQHLTSLKSLHLWNLDDLKILERNALQHLTSLVKLDIWDCKSLESLPEDQLPSSLELLEISSCPLLEARYQSRKGKHWSKIAHVPAIQINNEVTI